MSRLTRFERTRRVPAYSIVEPSTFYPSETLILNPFFPTFPIVEEELEYVSDVRSLHPRYPTLIDEFDALTDLIQEKESTFYFPNRRLARFHGYDYGTGFYLQSLCDRVADLELGFDNLVERRKKKFGDRKYTWTAEIHSPDKYGLDRKYSLTTEIKEGKDLEKKIKWSAETKRRGSEYSPINRTYTYKVSHHDGNSDSEKGKKKKLEKVKGKSHSVGSKSRLVEIEDPSHHGASVLKQVFAKRVEKRRGKRSVLSPQEAATLIQITFRAYLIRRSKALRALRELAIAKTKLKEIRVLFHNFSYRRRLISDAEEKQRFSEKIIVLLLTVDGIEGVDRTVRAAKRSIVDELEAMLDVVDPQPPGKSLYLRRRTFDMPDGTITKELASGVSKVVQIIDEDLIGDEAGQTTL